MTEHKKPKINSESQRELDKAQKQFDAFDDNIKTMTLDRMNEAPTREQEQQTKLSQSEFEKSKDIYLKPKRTIHGGDKFNEKYREEYNFAKEYVNFIAENKEIIGENIPMWTKPFAGIPAEEWEVPVNTPIWGPRYLAEQIKRKNYHRFVMQDKTTGGDGSMQYYGSMAVDTTVQRLDAHPVSQRKSVFMGNINF